MLTSMKSFVQTNSIVLFIKKCLRVEKNEGNVVSVGKGFVFLQYLKDVLAGYVVC